jgi:hypothetical protein
MWVRIGALSLKSKSAREAPGGSKLLVVDLSIFIATGAKDLPEDKLTTFIGQRFGVGTEDSLRKG